MRTISHTARFKRDFRRRNQDATDTALVLAHVDIAEKSNEIPAAQALLAELGIGGDTIVTLDALHRQNISRSRQTPTSP